MEANAVVKNEFATNAANDNRFVHEKSSMDAKKSGYKVGLRKKLDLEHMMSDNAMISIYPLGKKYFCFYESPFITGIDPITLNTMDRVDLNRKLGLFCHGSHPHYDPQGDMFTVGVKIGLFGPEYVIHKFPKDAVESFEGGKLMARVRSRWMLEPGYMHSFAVTDNYFILIEQPLTVHAPTLAKGTIT